jgi:hypothetical protein
MAAVQNLPYGPFRSGAWGRGLQSSHTTAVEESGPDADEFKSAVASQAQIEPRRFYGSLDPQPWWAMFTTLPYCLRSPTVLKFARWWSISDCWRELRPNFFFVPMVVNRMIGDTGDKETTALWNAEMQNKETSGKGGLLKKVPGYINLEMVDCLDVFCLVTHPIRKYSGQNLVDVKDCHGAVAKMRDDAANGGYETVILDTAAVLGDMEQVTLLCGNHVDAERRKSNCKLLWDMNVQLQTELIIRMWPAAGQWPGISVVMCVAYDKDLEEAKRWVAMCAKDWFALVRWEKATHAFFIHVLKFETHRSFGLQDS